MIRPDIILRMRQNRFFASIPALASVFAGSLAQDYTDLIREAVGLSGGELQTLAEVAAARGDHVLETFARHVLAVSDCHRRAA